jgi:hypothetical protein
MFWIHDCRSWQGSNVAATYDRSVIVVYVNGVANGSKSVCPVALPIYDGCYEALARNIWG